MPKLLSTLPLVVFLSLGTAISAQEDTTTEADTATESSAESEPDTTSDTQEADDSGAAEDGAANLDMGEEVQNPTYIKEQYGDWQMKCFRSDAEEDPCHMYQLLHEEAGNPIAEFTLFRLPGEAQAVAGATVVVPLGTLIPEELKISVDGGRAKSYSYSFCTMVGCFARIGLTQDDINALKAGSAANLQIVPAQAPNQKVDIKVSLDGFTAAFDNVTVSPN